MTYQIIDKESGKAMNLNEFDRIYCEQTGEKFSEHNYASWHGLLEMAFNTHIEMNALPEGYFKESFVHNSNNMSTLEFIRLLYVWAGKYFLSSDTFESVSKDFNYMRNLITFLTNNKDKYEFFHF